MNSIISKINRIATILLASTALTACGFFSSGSGDHIPTPVISVSPEGATLYVGMEITLSAANSTDQDGDQLSYAWSQPEGQAIALNPTESDTNVTVNFIANAAGSYTFTLTVSDGKYENSTEIVLDILVDEANEPPVFTSSSDPISVSENFSAVVHTAAASDPEDDALTYSLAGSDAEAFSIDASSGALSFANAPDFEAPADADGDNTYELSLQASDGKASVSQSLTISVTDVNEAPSITSAASADVIENSTGTIHTAAASDPEGKALTYTISGTDADDFNIDSSSGALSFANAPDFEIPSDADGDNTYQLNLEASDGTNTSSQALTISVSNVNEAPTITSAAATSVNENTTGSVYTIAASDVDADDTHTYSIVGGADKAFFIIDGAELGFVSAPDYETPPASGDNTYEVELRATDAAGLYGELKLSITVDNVDEQPTFTSAASVEVAENTATASIVYTATASDPEGASLSYQIVAGSDVGAFQQITSAGNQGKIQFAASPDFESPADADGDNAYELTISVSDGTTDPITQAITIVVTDVNEAPTITSTETGFTVSENTTSSIHNVAATDPENTTLIYGLSGADADDFAIDSSGVLSFVNNPDFEAPTDADTDNVYSVTLEVSDGTNIDTQALTITVTGVDEAPTINNTATSVLFTENATGTVFDASATDPENATLNYSLSGADADDLSIDSAGLITFNSSPDYDIPVDANGDNNYELTIEVGDGANTSTQAVTITVENVNEAPTITNTNTAVSTAEDTVNNPSAFEYAITATDPEGEVMSYALGGADATDFDVDSDGVITFKSGRSGTGYDPNFEHPVDDDGDNVYQLDLYAQDASGNTSSSVAITISVTNEPEAPTFASASDEALVSENTSSVFYLAEASDDDGDSVSYSLAAGVGDNDLFTIDPASGQLSFISAPDYENPTDSDPDGTYNVTISASDGSLSSTFELAVTVSNVNEAPAFASASASTTAPENSTTTFYTAAASDPEDASLSYSLVDGVPDNSFFSITTSGELRFLEVQDREAAANDANTDYTYEVQITASDGTYSTETALSLAVTLENVNEAPTVTNTVTAISVVEDTNSSPVSFQYTITASDPENDSLVYSISGTDAAAFDVDPGTGLITFKAGVSGTPYDPNYEYPSDAGGDNLYQLNILASDSALDSSSLAIQVSVTNVGAEPNFVNSSGTSLGSGDNFADSASFAENGTGAAYTAITVDDDDTDDFVKYHITGGVDSDLFEITNDQTGEIFFKSAPDYESAQDDDGDNTYVVEVNATDHTDTTVITLSITIDNLNDNAPAIAAQSLDIIEDAANGSTVGAVTVSDADEDSGLTTTYQNWQITAGNTNSAFAIDASGDITVADTTQINYESGTTIYSLSVSVSDGDNTGSGTVTVNINDTNDEAPVITSASYDLAESASAGTSLDTLAATDPDTGLATTLQDWTITSGNSDGIFALDPDTGALTVADTTNLDYDVGAQSYSLLVTVSDGANTSAAETITVNITDVNDNDPVITANQSFSTSEASPDTTVVGTVLATDADGDGSGTTFQDWTITGGTSTTAFAIDSSTGVLTVANTSELVYSSGTTSYTLTLTVKDTGGANTSAEQSITIAIEENILPSDFAATGGLGLVTLQWSVAADTTYDIYRSTEASCDITNYASCADPALHVNQSSGMEDTGLDAQVTYYYWMQVTRTSPSPTLTQVSATPISATTLAMGVLNDTGTYFAARNERRDNSVGDNSINEPDCNNSDVTYDQDCDQGRDATHNDDSDGYYGFSFTKLDSNGAELSASASSWSCVRDNVTGLTWEVKTSDGSVYDKSKQFQWGGITAIGYDSDSADKGTYYDSATSIANSNDGSDYSWDTLVNTANSGSGLCGGIGWRVPTLSELHSLADYGFFMRHGGMSTPSIDENYFPNAIDSIYLSATPYVIDNTKAWYVHFYNSSISKINRSSAYYVRLVRSN